MHLAIAVDCSAATDLQRHVLQRAAAVALAVAPTEVRMLQHNGGLPREWRRQQLRLDHVFVLQPVAVASFSTRYSTQQEVAHASSNTCGGVQYVPPLCRINKPGKFAEATSCQASSPHPGPA